MENQDEYYSKLNIQMKISSIWDTLQSKSEYGSSKSERGYQEIAKLMARRIAHITGANPDLAEILTMCKGCFFPINGKAGKACMMDYLKSNGIEMSEADLATQFIKTNLNRRKEVITPEFESYLHNFFDDDPNVPRTKEMEIADLCHDSIEGVKRIEKYSQIPQDDLLYSVSEDTVGECEKNGKPSKSKKLEELLQGVPSEEIEQLSPEQEERVQRVLKHFMEEFPDKGIYYYIAAPDVSER